MPYTAKELAVHCFDYTIPVCHVHHVDRTELLTHLAELVRSYLSRDMAMDPDRNK